MQTGNYSIKEILAEWQAKLQFSNNIKQHIKKGIILSISGDNGGLWTFQPTKLTKINSDIDDSDCIIYLDLETLKDIYIGKITPQEAHLSGKLTITGSESIAMYFSLLMIKGEA